MLWTKTTIFLCLNKVILIFTFGSEAKMFLHLKYSKILLTLVEICMGEALWWFERKSSSKESLASTQRNLQTCKLRRNYNSEDEFKNTCIIFAVKLFRQFNGLKITGRYWLNHLCCKLVHIKTWKLLAKNALKGLVWQGNDNRYKFLANIPVRLCN